MQHITDLIGYAEKVQRAYGNPSDADDSFHPVEKRRQSVC
ncbi:hypothetical protein L1281_000078 [Neisseria sp. HSC-16F19]|nr:hypothetical protein [Neisseria sp. HSC-16F19]